MCAGCINDQNVIYHQLRKTGIHLLNNWAIKTLVNWAQNLHKVSRYHLLTPAFHPSIEYRNIAKDLKSDTLVHFTNKSEKT